MQNAHLRMGKLHYFYSTSKRTTDITVALDRIVVEPNPDPHVPGRIHLLSAVGSDAEISAISAALSNDSLFSIEVLGEEFQGMMTAKPDCYRASISVADRNRPLRHLLAISSEFTEGASSSNPQRVFLLDSSPSFVFTNLAYIYGLPARPEWADWFCRRLLEEQAVTSLRGIGCDPVAIQGDRDRFLGWLGYGRRAGQIDFPEMNGPILWPSIALTDVLGPVPADVEASVSASQ